MLNGELLVISRWYFKASANFGSMIINQQAPFLEARPPEPILNERYLVHIPSGWWWLEPWNFEWLSKSLSHHSVGMEFHHPNWRTHSIIFQRGRFLKTTKQHIVFQNWLEAWQFPGFAVKDRQVSRFSQPIRWRWYLPNKSQVELLNVTYLVRYLLMKSQFHGVQYMVSPHLGILGPLK